MICPICKGGKTLLKKEQGKGCYEVVIGICDKCHGSGEVQMTEQEYIQTCNTEQLADVIADFYLLGYTHGHNKMDITSRTKWSEWLKQPHKENG